MASFKALALALSVGGVLVSSAALAGSILPGGPVADRGWETDNPPGWTVNGLTASFVHSGTIGNATRSNFTFDRGKVYVEFTILSGSGSGSNDGDQNPSGFGLVTDDFDNSAVWETNNSSMALYDTWDHARAFQTAADGSWYESAPNGRPFNFVAGDVMGFAVDADAGKAWVSRNGVWGFGGTSVFSNTLTPLFDADFIARQTLRFAASSGVLGGPTRSGGVTANFGATPFAYSVPAGFNEPVDIPDAVPLPATLALLLAGLAAARAMRK